MKISMGRGASLLAVSAVLLGLSGCGTMSNPLGTLPDVKPDVQDESARASALGGTAGMRSYRLDASAGELMDDAGLPLTRVFYFDFDSDVLRAGDLNALRAHGAYAATHPSVKLRLEGHADERGSREYNLALGERRARSVVEILRVEGVAENQVQVHSYGEETPLNLGRDELSWQQNRRVELVYVR